MQDYVTPETAIKLEEAGFPQPTSFTYGQMWYDRSNSDKIAMGVLSDKSVNSGMLLFAPRVTDIMLHLPQGCELIREVRPGIGENIWFVFTPSSWSRELKRKFTSPEGHANAAEAAARMWLKLNKK